MSKVEITAVLLEFLKGRAQAATPGPWASWILGGPLLGGDYQVRSNTDPDEDFVCRHVESAANANYIAAASPDVVLALIEKIEAIERPDMTDELELDSENIFDRLIALIAISTPEVTLTMKDGSVKRALLDADKIVAELQKAKNLVDKTTRLEREADWLASNGEGEEECPYSRHHLTERPDWCKVLEEEDECGTLCICDGDPARCWREAARKAVEPKSDLFDHLAEHPDTKLAPEEE